VCCQFTVLVWLRASAVSRRPESGVPWIVSELI
jgi:hypothetical protein